MSPKYIDRPPRIQPELPVGNVIIPSPPDDEDSGRSPLRQVLLPLVTIAGYLLLSLSGQGRNLALMIPMGLSVVVSTVFAFHSYRKQKAEEEEAKEAYIQRLTDLRREMNVKHDMQRTFYHYNQPDPDTVLAIATGESRSRAGSRLWERRPDDRDFGALRLGIGTRQSTITYKLSENDNRADALLDDARRLAEDSRFVDDIPITVPMRRFVPDDDIQEEGENEDDELEKVFRARHAIGIAGDNVAKTSDFMRAVLVQLLGFHSPADLQVHVVGPEPASRRWEWAVWLPHLNTRDESYIGDRMCFDPDAVETFWESLLADLDNRQQRLQDEDSGGDVTLPHILLVVDKLNSVDPDHPMAEPEAEEAASIISRQGPQLGASVIYLVQDGAKVPSDCNAVIEVEPVGQEVAFRYAEIGLNSKRYLGTADTLDPVRAEKKFAQQIKDHAVRRGFGEDLTTYVTLTDMEGVHKIDELKIADNWERSRQPEHAQWLSVPIGMMGGNKIRELTFSADEDGVHGMIAGTTGSGKSELLLTMIAGMAIRYDPSILNFVLVDYKGGSAFEPFRPLPHTVDIATNLEGNAVERMFIAIKAELDRRGKVLKDYNVKHIVEYRKKGYHLEEPFPHLFVIVDEFAEMIAENPEYKAQFDSITRLGRAIGVSLILATQRPTGAVTDQMRANMKFRMCLRVETPDDSRELLRRSDAAFLPSNVPGRTYIQVGNEGLTTLQVARTGGPYTANEPVITDDVIWLDDLPGSNGSHAGMSSNGNPGDGSAPAEDAVPAGGDGGVDGGPAGDGQGGDGDGTSAQASEAPLTVGLRTENPEAPDVYSAQEISDAIGGQKAETLVDWIVGAAAITARRENVPTQTKPWPDPLPERLPVNLPVNAKYINTNRPHEGTIVLSPQVQSLIEGQTEWEPVDWRADPLAVDIGIVDNPYDSEQRLLRIDLTRGPHVLFGSSGWGKTTFVRTLMTALAAKHSPAELHMYALDFGKGGLNAMRALPHLGGSIDATENARVERLLRILGNTVEARRTKVMEYGSLVTYNSENPDDILPAILVVIDNFGEFKETYEDEIPTLVGLVRDGRAFGINFLITASQTSDVPGKVYSLFTERMTLKLPDTAEYNEIVGRGAPNFNDVPGRGAVNINRTPLEFQTAVPITSEIETSEEALEEGLLYEDLSQGMAANWEGDIPDPVEILHEKIMLRPILESLEEEPTGLEAVIGINDLDRDPTTIQLQRQGPHLVLTGPPLSGKTTALRSMILSLTKRYGPGELGLILIDPRKNLYTYGGEHELSDLPHVLLTVSEPEEMDLMYRRLSSEFDSDWIELIQAKDEKWWKDRERPLIVIADSYDEIENLADHRMTEQLATLARSYGSEGLHFVLGGSLSITRGRDELLKQVQSPRYSLVLQDAEAARSMGGRISYGSLKAEYPAGRGFVVKAVRTRLAQIAMPYDEADDEPAEQLDQWVEEIQEAAGRKQALWAYTGPEKMLDIDELRGEIEGQKEIDELKAAADDMEDPEVREAYLEMISGMEEDEQEEADEEENKE